MSCLSKLRVLIVKYEMEVPKCERDVANLHAKRRDNLSWKSHGINTNVKSSHKRCVPGIRNSSVWHAGEVRDVL